MATLNTASHLERYKDLYKWMILPLIIMQLGIFGDYWGDFTENAFSVHVHYWTGTIWYLYLIIQPYYAVKGQMERHRTNGMIGMFLAGGVALTAFSMMHRDIVSAERAAALPERFGPFEPWFFYGVMAVEIPMIVIFGYAVIQSILKRKKVHEHAWWLVSTVFVIMFPALGRGVQNAYIGIMLGSGKSSWMEIDPMTPIYGAAIFLIGLTILAAWKFGKVRHPATYLAVGINALLFFMEPIGRCEGFQWLMNTLIKG